MELVSKAPATKEPKLPPSHRDRPVLGVRLPRPTARWLRNRARRLRVPLCEVVERLIREEHDKAKQERGDGRCGVAECIATQGRNAAPRLASAPAGGASALLDADGWLLDAERAA